MRTKLMLLMFFILSLPISAEIYYVSPRGNDTNNGLDTASNHAWLTWTKGFSEVDAGDTLYILDGVYISETEYNHPRIDPYGYIYTATGHVGTKANPISIFAYPGATPILDCRNHVPYNGGSIIHGVTLAITEYIHMRGLTIRNLWQRGLVNLPQGITIVLAQNLKFENCTFHDISGRAVYGNTIVGFYSEELTPFTSVEDSTYFINCDFYNLCDSTSANPGNAADGIKITLNGRQSDTVAVQYYYLYGCRFWYYSDDGSDIGGAGIVVHENCWASSTDKFAPLGIEGNGFKSGIGNFGLFPADSLLTTNWRIYKNNIAANCEGEGFYDLDYIPYFRNRALYYNNTAYNNLVGYTAKISYSFRPRNSTYKNNIVYSSNKYENATFVEVEIGSNGAATYPESHNTWDAYDPSPGSWPFFHIADTTLTGGVPHSIAVTDDDFVSLDATQMFGARKADGSLPDITFLTLSPSSDLIDAGIDVGMAYTGAAPDLGYAEYGGVIDSTLTDIITFVLPEETGNATINATTHTVSIGVAFAADVTDLTPTIGLSYGATVSPLSGVSQDFTSPVVYTVTALDETTEQAWTVTVTKGADPSPGSSAIVKFNGKIVKQ